MLVRCQILARSPNLHLFVTFCASAGFDPLLPGFVPVSSLILLMVKFQDLSCFKPRAFPLVLASDASQL